MAHKLIVKVSNAYGRKLYMPVCAEARKVAELLKQTSFSERDIQKLKELGYTFETPSETI